MTTENTTMATLKDLETTELEPTIVEKPEEKEEEVKIEEGKEEEEEEEEEEDDTENPEEEGEGEEEEEEDDDSLAFWRDVDKLRGEEIEVNYGDVDPLSPEGVLIREKVIEDRAIENFEKLLQQKAPRGYEFLNHIINGGKEEDFFKTYQPKDWGKVSLDENAYKDDAGKNDKKALENVQVQVLKEYYTRRGLEEGDIEELIETALDKGQLKTKAEAAHAAIVNEDKEKIERMNQQLEEQRKVQLKAINEMSDKISSIIETGNIGNFVIPKKDKEGFDQFFKQNVRYDNGKFYIIKEIGDKDLEQEMQKEFFAYKKGNLNDLIERKAKTINARRLGEKKAKEKKQVGQESNNTQRKYTRLSDL